MLARDVVPAFHISKQSKMATFTSNVHFRRQSIKRKKKSRKQTRKGYAQNKKSRFEPGMPFGTSNVHGRPCVDHFKAFGWRFEHSSVCQTSSFLIFPPPPPVFSLC